MSSSHPKRLVSWKARRAVVIPRQSLGHAATFSAMPSTNGALGTQLCMKTRTHPLGRYSWGHRHMVLGLLYAPDGMDLPEDCSTWGLCLVMAIQWNKKPQVVDFSYCQGCQGWTS